MEWAEIKRRLTKEGTSVQVIADLEGVPYKTMYNRIMAHQVKDGVQYLTPANTKGMKKAKAISDTKQKQAKEKEKAAGLPEVKPLDIPEGLPEGVIRETLETANRVHAAAVKAMHELEERLKVAKESEMRFRAIVIGLEKLLEGK